MTEIYLIRHSKPLKVINKNNTDSLQIQNEKNILSIEGEEFAKEKFKNKVYENIDIVYSSSYVRAIQTAKYLASYNNLDINIDERLNERKFGILSWDEMVENFEKRQFEDENYKIGNGESQKDVRDRIYEFLVENKNSNKKIACLSHATAIRFILMKWCLKKEDGLYFKDKKIVDFNKCDFLETYKLSFEDGELIDIDFVL